jgi:hypothetical protein
MEYTNREKYGSPEVDGYILVGPVSDREAASIFMTPEDLNKTVLLAREMIDNGCDQEIMPAATIPPIFNSPITAYRWHSLAAEG